MDPVDDRPTALIYRKRLLYWSETFIAAQGNALERYRPLFVGLRYKKEGHPYLGDAPSATLEEHALSYGLAKAALRAGGWITPRWRRAIAAHRPTVVHAHFGWEAIDGAALARRFDVPLVVTFHGMDIAVQRGTRTERRQRETAFREAARIIAVSGFIAEKVLAAGAPEEKLVVHHIGVDTQRFAPGSAPRAENEILFVGRLVEKKGLIHLLRAMPRIQAASPGATLTIAGDGSLREELKRAATELGVNATWLGVQKPDQVRELMRRATVFCAPSIVGHDGNAEGLPMTIVEAQASGMPVVVFPSGGSAEGVRDGETGWVVPSKDENALADRVIDILTDRALRDRFSQAAREWAVREFDLRTQTRRLEEIYDSVRSV